jgi:hypothetical protein
MNLEIYILGSYYVVRSLFRLSEKLTDYLFRENIITLPISKYEKINEAIYSSAHSVLVSVTSALSITAPLFMPQKDNQLQYLSASICFSYFLIDLAKCLYHKKYLFILHHLAALNLLGIAFYNFKHYDHKGYYVMYLIFLLESNNVLLNIGFLLKELKFHYSITCTSWTIHLFSFILFRILTVPKVIFLFYYNEPPTLINLSQLPSIFLILSGSLYWAYRQSIGIQKYLKENSVI